MLSLLKIIIFLTNVVISTGSNPAKRSLEYIEDWLKPDCQNYLSKGYFSTIEDSISCNSPHKKNCPTYFNHPEFGTKYGNIRRWPCRSEKFIDQRINIVSHRHKVIYANVPKVASSTLNWLMARGLDNYVDPGTEYYNGRSYIPLSKIPKEKLDDYFIFTFIRDPITKMESGISEAKKYNNTLTNTEFLLHLDDGCGMNYHTFSQAKYFKQINPYTRKDLEYDFVGSLETFDEDFAFLRRILLLPPSERRKMVKYSLTVYDPQFKYINSIYGAPKMNPIPKSLSSAAPTLNAGKKESHSVLDYSVNDIRSAMCKVTDHDRLCFPRVSKKNIGC